MSFGDTSGTFAMSFGDTSGTFAMSCLASLWRRFLTRSRSRDSSICREEFWYLR